jgi:hypothetical protein
VGVPAVNYCNTSQVLEARLRGVNSGMPVGRAVFGNFLQWVGTPHLKANAQNQEDAAATICA